MSAVAKTHQASRQSVILNPSIRIEPVRTNSRGGWIGIDSADVDREQRAGRNIFRTSIVVQDDIPLGAAIKRTYNGLKSEYFLQYNDPADIVPIEKSLPQLRAVKEMPCRENDQLAGGGYAGNAVGDALGENLAAAVTLFDQKRNDVFAPLDPV